MSSPFRPKLSSAQGKPFADYGSTLALRTGILTAFALLLHFAVTKIELRLLV